MYLCTNVQYAICIYVQNAIYLYMYSFICHGTKSSYSYILNFIYSIHKVYGFIDFTDLKCTQYFKMYNVSPKKTSVY